MFKALSSIFRGKSHPDPDSDARVAEAVATVKAMARPCLRVVASDGGKSQLGGLPALSRGQDWPRRGQVPMAFFAHLDLVEVRAAGGPDWLPPDGGLQFFYDLDYGTQWTQHPNSGEAVRVIYLPAGEEVETTVFPPDLSAERRYMSYPIGFEADVSLPSFERYFDLHQSLSKRERAAFDKALDQGDFPSPCHQIAGYPDPIQDDSMEGSWASQDENAADPEDWRLLLQLDWDEKMKFAWMDGARLYFWALEKDARAGDFSNVWVTVQFF
jgi:uncharacterized protein YwqG